MSSMYSLLTQSAWVCLWSPSLQDIWSFRSLETPNEGNWWFGVVRGKGLGDMTLARDY